MIRARAGAGATRTACSTRSSNDPRSRGGGTSLNSHGGLGCDILLAIVGKGEAEHAVAEPRDSAGLFAEALLDEERIVGGSAVWTVMVCSSIVSSAIAWTYLRNSVRGVWC